MRITLALLALTIGVCLSGSAAGAGASPDALVFFQEDTGLGFGYEGVGYLCQSALDGAVPARLAFDLGPGDDAPLSPAFSPDGVLVAFVAPGLGGNHLPEIFVAPAAGGALRAAAPNVGFASSPTWTADGRWVVFGGMDFNQPLGVRHDAFFRVGSNGRDLEELPGGAFGASPAVSPDGTLVAFSGGRDTVDGQGDLQLLDVASGRVMSLTREAGWESEPSWSPDGRTIVFQDDTGPLTTQLSTIQSDGSGRRDLPGSDGGHDPAFSSDGTTLAFARDEDIWVADSAGAGAVNVTRSPPGEGQPAWQPGAGSPRSTRPCAIVGTANADVLRGSRYADVFYDRGGNDTIFAGAGADTIYDGSGDDRIWAGFGRDWIELGDGRNTTHGGPGDDGITGRFFPKPARRPQRIFGDAGDDRIYGGLAADVIDGGSGRDLLFGMPGADSLFGGLGADQLAGGRGADSLTGGAGHDLFLGGPGDDRLFAADATQDRVHGGPGEDAARWDPQLDFLLGVEANARIPRS